MNAPIVASRAPALRLVTVVSLAALLSWILPGYAAAQDRVLVTIAPNAQVRVTPMPDAGPRVTGRFVSLTADTLTFTTGRAPGRVAMPVAAVQRLDVRGPRQRVRAATIGAGVLGGIALVFGGIDVGKGSLEASEYIGAVAGNAVIGALVGAAVAPRGWTRIR